MLEYSADLKTWALLTSVTNHFGVVQFLDATARQVDRRYYRAWHSGQ